MAIELFHRVYLRSVTKPVQGHIALFAAQVIYALNYSIAKDLMPAYLNPMAIVFFRVLGACLLFWLTAAVVGLQKVEKKDIWRIALLAVFGVVVNQVFFIYGLSITTPINSSIIMISNPVMVFVFSLFVMKERISGTQISGLLLAIIGAVIILSYRGNFELGSDTALGDLYTLINSTSWAIFIVMAKPIMVKYKTITAMAWLFLFGSLLMLPLGTSAAVHTNWSVMTPYAWFALSFVVVATTFLAYLLNLFGLQVLSPNTVSAYIYLQPFLASIFAIIFDKDAPTPTKIFSGVLIIAGLYLVNRKKVKNNVA